MKCSQSRKKLSFRCSAHSLDENSARNDNLSCFREAGDGCLRSCENHVSSRFIDLEKLFMYSVENLKVEVERLESHVARPFITRHYYENF